MHAGMRRNITRGLRDFRNASIRGPDFVRAATGPPLEAFSRHPVAKTPGELGALMKVCEFPSDTCRVAVDFVAGCVFTGDEDVDAASGHDIISTCSLVDRGDLGPGKVPAGACIHALSRSLLDRELAGRLDILPRSVCPTSWKTEM